MSTGISECMLPCFLYLAMLFILSLVEEKLGTFSSSILCVLVFNSKLVRKLLHKLITYPGKCGFPISFPYCNFGKYFLLLLLSAYVTKEQIRSRPFLFGTIGFIKKKKDCCNKYMLEAGINWKHGGCHHCAMWLKAHSKLLKWSPGCVKSSLAFFFSGCLQYFLMWWLENAGYWVESPNLYTKSLCRGGDVSAKAFCVRYSMQMSCEMYILRKAGTSLF